MSSWLFRQSLLSLRAPCRARFTSTLVPEVPPEEFVIHEAYKSKEKIDVEALFLNYDVRHLLRKLSSFSLERIYSAKRCEFTPPQYKFMTDEQLQRAIFAKKRYAKKLTFMPPVMRMRQATHKELRRDPEIQGRYKNNFIFTDISFGYPERERVVVVRQPDGILRTATWDERERMLHAFFRREGKRADVPGMFQEPSLTQVLDKGWYKFLFDRACAQFDPDDPRYLVVTQRAYEHLRESKKFDTIRSTRHFGPMCLYYAVTRSGDPLMLELILTNRIGAAAAFVRLLHIVHPGSKSEELVDCYSSNKDYVKAYIKAESQTQAALELAYQTYLEIEAQREAREEKEEKMKA